ncbi:hypothetical protein COCOBI_15-4350 [Coccomyxa sp. Obi]|nr:hypothetical protein COCOBI_15-4350 [Coccomyxa sp. Obi]
MDLSDRILLPPQYIYPNSHQRLSTVPTRPFTNHNNTLEKCICETHFTGRKCPYHAVLSVAPEQRSAAMKAVVKSHDLVIEAGKLLLTTRAHTQDEDCERLGKLRGAVEDSKEGEVLEKAAVKLIKAALVHGGVSVHIPMAPLMEFCMRTRDSGLAADTDLLCDYAHSTVCCKIASSRLPTRPKWSCKEGISAANDTNILLLQEDEGRSWEPFLERHGLIVWDLELVLRLHQSQAIRELNLEDLPSAEKEVFTQIFITNGDRISAKDPGNTVNILLCPDIGDDKLACQIRRDAMEEADKLGDAQMASLMRWQLCHLILLGGEGEHFAVAEVILKLVAEARKALEYAAEWGMDTPMAPAKDPSTYWPCLGVAARCKACIKATPMFAQSVVDAFESREALDQQKRHVMCAQCEKLCEKLQRCSACQVVGYCSKSCQVKHWKAGHK